MITPPAIPGFTYSRLDYDDLLDRFLAISGWQSELLGDSVEERPIYGFSYGDPTKPTMYVQGNIHGGHEWRTCWWVSEFMALLHDPSGLPSATRDALLYLRDRYSFYFIPSVNPDGYQGPVYRYGNANGVSISENFDYMWENGTTNPAESTYQGPYPWSEPESQIVRDKVLELLPVSLLCNHTWSSTTKGYMSRVPQNAYDNAPFLEMWNEVNASLDYDETYVKERAAKLNKASAYNWAGTLTSTAGRTIIAQVWESGGGMTVEDQSRVGMTGILYHMLMVDALLPKPPTLPAGAYATAWGPYRVNGVNYPVTGVDMSIGGELVPIWRP